MTLEEIYRLRYGKYELAECYQFRDNPIDAKTYALTQTNLSVNLEKNDLIFNTHSLMSFIQLTESNLYFTSEAIIKTYPTKFLTKSIVKYLVDNCVNETDHICLYSPSLDVNKRLDDLFIYDGTKNRTYCFDNDCDNFDDFTINLKCLTNYVEGDIAGQITYVFKLDSSKHISFKSTDIEQLIYIGNRYGYDYVAYSFIDKTATLYLMFESKHQLSDIIISNYLYHVSPLSLKDKILKYGLSPKSKSFKDGSELKHSDRVYLFNGYDECGIKLFLQQLGRKSIKFNSSLRELIRTDDFVVFKIDKSKIQNLQLYRDNNFKSNDPKNPTAIYTYSNIPPNAIVDVKTIKI